MSAPYYDDETVTVHAGDCLDVLQTLPDASVDAVVTDPPYGLEFMGKEWDGANGFRRSLNPADTGCESPLGRMSRTSPEYRTDSKAQANPAQKGGHSATDGRPTFLGGLNPRCLVCDKWQRGSNPCKCEAPQWTQERLVRLHSFQEWCEAWATECLRILKPGGHLLAFGGTRTSHRLACAIEDAGFEIRDSIAWLYGSGFPKSLDVSKAIDRAAGAQRAVTATERVRDIRNGHGRSNGEGINAGARSEPVYMDREITGPATDDARHWEGWGTALKPAHEPIVVARKPLVGTVAATVLAHGTGALNIDGCRVGTSDRWEASGVRSTPGSVLAGSVDGSLNVSVSSTHPAGRWPGNVVLDESQAAALDAQSGERVAGGTKDCRSQQHGYIEDRTSVRDQTYDSYGDTGGASRFFYTAKADGAERVRLNGIAHPTVKPLSLMRWLVRLVTPPGGLVLEPFAGSGTTVEACILEGFRCVAIEREADYLPLIVQRINRRRDPVAAVAATSDDGGLFDLLDVERVELPDDTRAGEASADRRYTANGGTNFAMKPGRRYRDGGAV